MKINISSKLAVIITVIATMSLALLLGCKPQGQTPKTDAPPKLEKVSLRLQWLDQAQFAGFYMAKEKGYYQDEGLDVTINPGGQDYNAATLVGNGSDDFGIWTADQVMLAASRGVPIQAVGVVFDRSLAAFMVKASSGIKTPKDFEGKTVGMYYGYDTETIYLHLLKQFNVDRSKIKEVALQYDLTPFLHGDVDVWPAYVINQPITAKLAGVDVNLLTPEQFGIHYYSDTIIVSDKTLKERSDTVIKFLKATELGWEYAINHRDETIDVVMKTDSHLDRKQQSAMLDVVADYLNKKPMFAMDPTVWNSIASLLLEQGLLKEQPKLDDFVDFKIAQP